jgi:tetratricopeptide (TPR) repeat protein
MPSYGLFNQIYAGKNDLNGAIEVLKKINVSEENSKPILMNIGNLYSLMKSDTIAVQYFEKAYNLDRTDKKLCNHLVKLFNMQGETEKAQYYLNLCNS